MILNHRYLADKQTNKNNLIIKEGLIQRCAYFDCAIDKPIVVPTAIFDFRSPEEINEKPSIKLVTTETLNYALGVDFYSKANKKNREKLTSEQIMKQFYGKYLFECNILKAAIHDLANNPRPILFHCTAGKDRTGIFSVVLMEILGFSRQEIINEYLLIDLKVVEHIKIKVSKKYNLTNEQQINDLANVKITYLEEFYKSVENKYETFENYLNHFFQLTTEQINQLRNYYLIKY